MEETTKDVVDSSQLQKRKWCCNEFLYPFRGFWFMKSYLETTQRVVESFKPNSQDIILASFPKTGTTWLKALIHCITHRKSPEDDNVDGGSPLLYDHPQELIPSLETNIYVRNQTADEVLKDSVKVRALATHIPYQILGDLVSSCDCKIVYVTRNPMDTLISLWHFVQKSKDIEDDPWELETAVDQFCRGIVPFGPYYDHVLAYREESIKNPRKVFFVTYEELKENPKEGLKKLAEFLGFKFETELEVEEIVEMCSLETLSEQQRNRSIEMPEGFALPYSSFYRKGEVGDHMNYLDSKMIEKIDSVTREKFHGAGFVYGV